MTRLKKLISAALALSLLGGSAAMAQPFGRGGNQTQDNRALGRGGDQNRFAGRGGGPGNFDRDGDGSRDRLGGIDRNRGGNFGFGFGFGPGFRPGFGPGPGYRYDPFHGGYGYGWRVGQRFSPYGLHYFVVDDWYRYHLRRPPFGYHWVRVDNDFLLVGITSGIIADLLLNQYNYY